MNQTHEQLIRYSLLALLALLLGYVVAIMGIGSAIGMIVLPISIGYFFLLFSYPRIGIITVMCLGFLAIGLNRYIVSAPLGLSIDIVLLFTLVAILMNGKKNNLKLMFDPLMLIIGAWFLYTIFQIFNPEAKSFQAWFYAVRGVSLYMTFLIALALVLFRKEKDMDLFFKIWISFSVVAALWAAKQIFFGVDSAEKKWLDDGGAITHILNGKLRAFSFYSDAGQYGAAAGHAGMICALLGFGTKDYGKRFMLLLASGICFWGMLLSGTRGALFVPIFGFSMYFFLTGNVRILMLGFLAGALFLAGLKYTTIGSGNDQIRRMRTALDPNDASLQVRFENQRKLATYLQSRPFGGGIGSGGTWGQRFSPGTFLADTPLDSWYVKIWVEGGIVGLLLHLSMIISIVVVAFKRIYRLEASELKIKLMALLSGFFGISVASYGNQIFGQMPTAVIMYLSIVFMFLAPELEASRKAKLTEQALI